MDLDKRKPNIQPVHKEPPRNERVNREPLGRKDWGLGVLEVAG